MAKITVNLDGNQEKIVSVLKGLKGYSNKEKAIQEIISEYGKQINITDMIKKVDGKK